MLKALVIVTLTHAGEQVQVPIHAWGVPEQYCKGLHWLDVAQDPSVAWWRDQGFSIAQMDCEIRAVVGADVSGVPGDSSLNSLGAPASGAF